VSASSHRIGWLAAAAIVALRVGIGVHFLAEGLDKLADPQPFSAGFFGNAKGPLAPVYQERVWDPDGLYRLHLDSTRAHWKNYRDQLVNHYGFDEKQAKKVDDVLKTYDTRLRWFLDSKRDVIAEYSQWLERQDANADDPARQLASLQAHDARIATETRKLRSELVPPIDALWRDLEDDLNAIATQDQWERHGRLAIGKPGRRPFDTETLDAVVPYFDVTIGALLILGLFTRAAALAGAAFLLTVCLAQWPGSPGAVPIYYQAVEMLALLVLAGVGAGRYLGIDFLFGGLKAMCCPPKSRGAVE
jgi:uncharacterized membrane protein YphA (DoxX/SURF4 family)